MTPVRITPSDHAVAPLGVEEFLSLLGLEHFDRIECSLRELREGFRCPMVVRDREEFHAVLCTFFSLYQKAFFNVDTATLWKDRPELRATWKDLGLQFVERHLSSYKGGIARAETNAIKGRDGALYGVLDTLTEELVKLHTEGYVAGVFRQLVGPNDLELRLRLADELLKQYGPMLCGDEVLQPHWVLGANLEHFIQAFTSHLNSIRREWRR